MCVLSSFFTQFFPKKSRFFFKYVLYTYIAYYVLMYYVVLLFRVVYYEIDAAAWSEVDRAFLHLSQLGFIFVGFGL